MSDTTVWRIAADTPTYEADDQTGAGAKATGGRWNSKGLAMVYASEARALACLETMAHLGKTLPLNRYLVAITIPASVWKQARRETARSVPVGWDAEPAGRASIGLGDLWLRSGASALLIVPSVIVREEANILINPGHPQSSGIKAVKVRRWLYDPRLRAI